MLKIRVGERKGGFTTIFGGHDMCEPDECARVALCSKHVGSVAAAFACGH